MSAPDPPLPNPRPGEPVNPDLTGKNTSDHASILTATTVSSISHAEHRRTHKPMKSSDSSSIETSSSIGIEPANANENGEHAEPPLAPVGTFLSRVMTNRTAVVPRSKRRGLFSSLTIIPEIENPMEYKRTTKHLVLLFNNRITLVVSIAGAVAPMASSILFPALGQLTEDLKTDSTTANISVSTYLLGMAVFPLWWSSFAERVGYRNIYIISFGLHLISNICCAVSVNISMLIVFRLLSGATAASAQSVGAGTIASIWEVKERGTAMGYFYLGPLCGPLLSPIVGGLLTQNFNWRATQWFLVIFGGVVWVFMVFFLPETLPKVIQPPKAPVDEKGNTLERTMSRVSARTKEHFHAFKVLFVDPLRSLLFMRFPPVLLTVYWASIAFGSLYILNVSIQKSFAKPPYNFKPIIVGLLYIPNSVGYFISSIVGGRWNDIVMRRAAERRRKREGTNELEYRPEDRMGLNALVAGTMFPLALIWYGWSVENGLPWPACMTATFFFGIGSMLIFSMATTMLTELVPGKSSSAVAVNNFFRNTFSCVGSVVAEPIINGIGNGWIMTILGIIGLSSLSVILIMQKWGPKWRASTEQYSFLR